MCIEGTAWNVEPAPFAFRLRDVEPGALRNSESPSSLDDDKSFACQMLCLHFPEASDLTDPLFYTSFSLCVTFVHLPI